MIQKVRYISLLLLSCLMTVYAYAADGPEHREFRPEHIEKYKNDPDYHYTENIRFSLFEWIDELLSKLERWLSRTADFGQPTSSVAPMRVFVWMVAILAVAGIMYIIFRGKWSWLLSGKKFKKKADGYSVYEEDIHNINFTDEIEQAVQEKNYRKATRLFYLKSLKLLSDAQVIEWKINKTNTDYRREIKDRSLRDEFDYLSTTFEYVWYGEFEPTEEAFHHTFEKFRRFNKHFQTTEA